MVSDAAKAIFLIIDYRTSINSITKRLSITNGTYPGERKVSRSSRGESYMSERLAGMIGTIIGVILAIVTLILIFGLVKCFLLR